MDLGSPVLDASEDGAAMVEGGVVVAEGATKKVLV